MARRDNQSQEARERERAANRARMAAKRLDPDYVALVNARRKERDRERKAADPELKARLRENRKRYFDRRKSDPDFWKKRHDYLRRWRKERLIGEEFEDFMNRIEGDADVDRQV
jgi:hypothetical protein